MGMTVHLNIDYDHIPGENEPTSIDIPFEELDGETLAALAVVGDQGAIDYINSLEDDPGSPDLGTVNEKGQIVLPPIDAPAGLAPGDKIEIAWVDDEAPPPGS